MAAPTGVISGNQFPDGSPALVRLCASSLENGGLLRSDLYTISDLLELSGYQSESLHALLLVMLVALDEGSLCVEVSARSLAQRLADLVEEAEAQDWAQRIIKDLDEAGYPELIGTSAGDSKPIIRCQHGGKDYLYFQKYLKYEQTLQGQLAHRLTCESTAVTPASMETALDEVLKERPLLMNGRPLKLNSDQERALKLAITHSFTIISGGPGTGKTSIVVTLLRCLLRLGVAPERIALAAPTGRAAQRLTDAIHTGLRSLRDGASSQFPQWEREAAGADAPLQDLAAQTLHHLLRYQPRRGTFRHHAENPIPFDVLVVDEVSMVGVELMAHLFQAIQPGAKIVLLGDKDQLPSVDAGAVLASLIPDGFLPRPPEASAPRKQKACSTTSSQPARLAHSVVILEKNYRSQTAIQEAARAINQQDESIVDSLPAWTDSDAASLANLEQQGGCWFLDQANLGLPQWRRFLEHWAAHHYLSPVIGKSSYQQTLKRCPPLAGAEPDAEQKDCLDRLFQILARTRILTLVRDSSWGCVEINAYLEKTLRPRLDGGNSGAWFAGAPVLINRNDPVRQLYNGDVGIALPAAGGSYRVVFARPDNYVAYPAETLPAHELAFAFTVHKAQGSEYGQVLLVLPPKGGRRLLTKEMIYTGITRARDLALVCGSKEVLRLAISRRINRESGLLGS